eukprot:577860_1
MVIWHTELNETYMVLDAPEKHLDDVDVDLPRSQRNIFLISAVLILIVISASIYYYQMRIFSFFDPNTTQTGYEEINEEILNIWEKLTVTEAIYEIFESNSIPREITNLIIKDYCGFAEITMNPRRKINGIKRLLLVGHIQVYPTYSGIILSIQYDTNV